MNTVAKTESVRVDCSKRLQEIDNFGASDCWSMQMIGAWSDESKNRVADLLFSETDGIGMSCWRFNIGGGVNLDRIGDRWRTVETFEVAEGEYDWTRQANEQWFLSAAKARGVDQFVAFVNSPPARMTRNGFTNCTEGPDSTNLKEGYEGQFARYLADIIKHFRDLPEEADRIDFDWVSPVNEPQWGWNGGGQEGCRASNEDIKALVKALNAEFRRQGLTTKVLVVESGIITGLWQENRGLSDKYGEKFGDYLGDFCGDPGVNGMIGKTMCAHSYLVDRVPHELVPMRLKLRDALAAYPDWKYWQTEYCVMEGPDGEGGGGRDLTMHTALNVARVMHCDLTIANASAWQWWTAVSSVDYKDGLIYTDYRNPGDPETIYPAKLLWVFGNYSRFVRPGARRVEMEGADDINGLMGSAYLSTDGSPLILVLINIAQAPREIRLDVQGLSEGVTVSSFVPYLTSDAAGDDLRQCDAIPASGVYEVPARSVVTLVGELSAGK